jgi:hypothetical protein
MKTFAQVGFCLSAIDRDIKFEITIGPTNNKNSSGCTAVAALITNDNKIYVV